MLMVLIVDVGNVGDVGDFVDIVDVDVLLDLAAPNIQRGGEYNDDDDDGDGDMVRQHPT